jgi:hypothetical protein
MRLTFLSFCCCFLLQGLALCADLPLPPTQQWLQVDAAGQFRLVTQATVCKIETRTRTVTKKIPETKTVNETVDGMTVTKNVTVYREVSEEQAYTVCIPVFLPILRVLSPESFQVFDADGGVLDLKQLQQRVGEGKLVLVSQVEGRLPTLYANLFRPETLVLVLKSPKTHQQPAVAASTEHQTPPVMPLPKFPAAPAPHFVLMARQGVDAVDVRRSQEATTSVQSTLTITKGQVQEQITVPLQRTLRQLETTVIPNQHLRFRLDQTDNIAFERIKEKLSREQAAVYSSDGAKVDPFWLQNLKSSSLVVVGPLLPDSLSGSMAPTFNSPQPVTPRSVMPPPSAPIPAPAAPK